MPYWQCKRPLFTISLTVPQLFEQVSRDSLMGCVLCMQIEKLKCFRTNGSEEVGGCKAECAEWHQFHQENADSGGKFAVEINGCYWEAFNRCSDSIIHVFLLLSIYRGTPLIDNLVSCPLILKDVRLYNKVKRSMFHFFFSMSKHPWECVCSFAIRFIKHKGVDDMKSSGRVWAPHECRSRSMSAHKSSGKQSQPVILLRVVLRSSEATKSTCAHTHL